MVLLAREHLLPYLACTPWLALTPDTYLLVELFV